MAKFLSDRSAQRLGPALDAIESLAPRKRNAPRRRIRSVGGGAAENRPWVVITSISSPGVYVGSSYDEPGGTLTEADISIKLKPVHDITPTNDFEVGWADFADVVTNSNGDKTYYINGFMLG